LWLQLQGLPAFDRIAAQHVAPALDTQLATANAALDTSSATPCLPTSTSSPRCST
jgi:Zn-dependent oligopeptidase